MREEENPGAALTGGTVVQRKNLRPLIFRIYKVKRPDRVFAWLHVLWKVWLNKRELNAISNILQTFPCQHDVEEMTSGAALKVTEQGSRLPNSSDHTAHGVESDSH